MDKGYEKEGFEKLGIKLSVAVKFRNFCKKISKSQSMTLLLMLEFFERNELSPEDNLKPNLMETENRIKKRINALIAIIKDIEKNQTKPTLAMLQSLFEVTEPKQKLMLEKRQHLGNVKLNQKANVRFQEKKEFQTKINNEASNNGEQTSN
ncbi:BfmA/BtgA family mobilization protein [Lacinutrix sp. Bg11-31]|uniref:BfmA/BtgA family mobilization protein n=1 Tax=Lacinutrix sp. Bg11-31 TaxID=2057808 RepID=UPI0018E26AE9|nr:BfmA/BtgA family mobilization protein [Lacinutrix sp. Bg11-31]